MSNISPKIIATVGPLANDTTQRPQSAAITREMLVSIFLVLFLFDLETKFADFGTHLDESACDSGLGP
jgi:hypothetical protein